LAEEPSGEAGENASAGRMALIGAAGIPWLRELVSLMNENDLAEVSLADGACRVRLRKASACAGAPTTVLAAGGVLPTVAVNGAVAAGAGAASAGVPASPSTVGGSDSDVVELKSPMVGTLYRAPSPDAAPFVEVGDTVSEESTVCIIEAMKVMNEIKAELAGVVAEILVASGEAVEYGQPLLRLRRTA